MATHLDLQEQEQVDALKAFWQQYGNLITWALVAALLVYAGITGWQWWQREQAAHAGAMFDEFDRALNAGDLDKTTRVWADLKERYPRTAYTQQAAMLTAKLQFDKGKADDARASLTWVIDHAVEDEYKSLARLRLAALLLDAKQYDDALKQLDAVPAGPFAALAADRRGDVLLAQGKKDAARAAYQQAYDAMDAKVEYRRLVDAKLTALGAAPAAASAASAASR
ncbi:MAG TPA: tetratricopeptide repeat protein [Burkholderiaceae bacterium]|jgi:predicted negative regulator of RcsB-dependent stress response|nr:tetratricopeptide repeat protein [Burkholderiaceae bacterium]